MAPYAQPAGTFDCIITRAPEASLFNIHRCLSNLILINHERNEIFLTTLCTRAIDASRCLCLPFIDLDHLLLGFSERIGLPQRFGYSFTTNIMCFIGTGNVLGSFFR